MRFTNTQKAFIFIFSLITVSLSSFLVYPVRSQGKVLPPFDFISQGWEALDMEEFKGYVNDLSSIGTRFTGTSGCEKAAAYIEHKFRSFGITNIEYHFFNITVPVDHGGNLTLSTGETVPVYPLQPNLVALTRTPPEGLTGPLVDVEDGDLIDFDNKTIEGSIVLMDFNSEYHWITAAKLGAKAVIFRESLKMTYSEGVMKRLDTVPFAFPRVYIKNEDMRKIKPKLLSGEPIEATIKCDMRWETIQSKNIIAYVEGTDPELKSYYIVLSASYDSFGFVPSVAPGARQAIGTAILLQLARYYATHPAKHTLVFIAFSGTNQGVEGSRWWVTDYINKNWETWGNKLVLQINFDLNDGSKVLLPTAAAGWLDAWQEGVAPWITDLSDWYFHILLPEMSKKLDMPELIQDVYYEKGREEKRIPRMVSPLAFATSPGAATTWNDLLGLPRRFEDNEPLVLIGGPGICWYDFNERAPYFGTPSDTADGINWKNIEYKLKIIYPITYATVNTNLRDVTAPILREWTPGYAGLFSKKWIDVVGLIQEYNITSGWYDPVPNALVVYGKSRAYPLGIWSYTMSDKNGNVFIPGLLQRNRVGGYDFYVYKMNIVTGSVEYAPGFGQYWLSGPLKSTRHARTYIEFDAQDRVQTFGSYTIFKCANIILFDIGDPHIRNTAIDRSTFITPNNFISHSPLEQYSVGIYGFGGLGASIAIVHIPAEVPVELIVQSGYALYYPFAILNNASESKVYGSGFTLHEIGEQLVINNTPLHFAKSFYLLNSARQRELNASGISMSEMDVLRHSEAKRLINEAHKALLLHQYSKGSVYAQEAWALSRDVYVSTRATIMDAINVMPFFGLTLIPFTFLTERLFFSTTSKKRILALIICYGIPTFVLSLLHPSFVLSTDPFMTLVGYAVVVLIGPMFAITLSATLDAMRKLRQAAYGVHYAEISRTSAAILAFSMGISNMRKRKLRTALMLLSIIIIVFSLVSFTSITTKPAFVAKEVPGTPLYNGVLIHHWQYNQWSGGSGDYEGTLSREGVPEIGERLLNELQLHYGDKAIISPRVWAYTGWYIRGTLAFRDINGKYIGFVAPGGLTSVLGVSVNEKEIVLSEGYLIAGRWFSSDDAMEIIIPDNMADAFEITAEEIEKEPPTISWAGLPFKVVGIVDSHSVSAGCIDLDGELILPLDPSIPGFQGHYHMETTFLVPYKTVIRMLKGLIVSVAMKFKPEYADKETILQVGKEIFEKTRITTWVAAEGKIYSYSQESQVSFYGWQMQVVPIVLAALTLLNMMIGSVHERMGEIKTYSSVGLSPLHTAFLFIAESLTYALVGGVVGYLIGVIITVITAYTAPGLLMLNYASTWVVTCVSMAMLITIASSLYPAFRSARMVTPSLERRWRMPRPKGDEWEIPLPLTMERDEEASGLLAYIYELAEGHRMPDSTVFRLNDIKLTEQEEPERKIRSLIMDVTLQPLELGIRQAVRFYDSRNEVTKRHSFGIHITRQSGARTTWRTVNRGFVDLLRKQILLWRSLSEKERDLYIKSFGKFERGGLNK